MSDKPATPVDKAAALKYSGRGAPRVVAKGQGEVASQIEKIAAEHGIPLIQDATLTGMLSDVPLGDEIPETLFYAVAEILVHIYKVGQFMDEWD